MHIKYLKYKWFFLQIHFGQQILTQKSLKKNNQGIDF
jgi:hypothetical protein